ncbi:Stk1 family PASTA domain-containing Ser/Thr kinase [Alteromonas gracilis]
MPHGADRGADPLVGRLLDGRYRIEDRVARGGMATVYTAMDTRLDRIVAVKVMHPGLGDDEEFARRFQREARAAARLSHHDVVAVYDRGEDPDVNGGTLYLVMEYVPGRTLRDVVRAEAPVSPARALSLIEPVLSALSAAHAAGLIHRDIKPENVLIADDGRVKVADFGLAKAINTETQATSQGVLIGTVSYLSPELVVDGTADARADVYAAGVILYELLTGQKPHQADSPIQVAYKHVHEDIPPPSRLAPRLPAYVDALVARATARDAALRPADAGVLLHHVRRVRSAVDQGVTVDDELAAELRPGRVVVDRFEDTDDKMPGVIVDPSSPHAAEQLSDADLARPEGDEEWSDEVFDQEHHTSRYHRPTSVQPAVAAPVRPTRSGPARSGPTRPTAVAPSAPRRPGRDRRRLVLVLAAALLVVALGGLGYWWTVARYTQTPALLNLDRAAAGTTAEEAGLGVDVVGNDFSETVERGLVLRSNPSPGERILEGGTVEVVLSRGPERYEVPALRGRSQDEAQQLLADTNLTFGRSTERYHEQIPEGDVIRTSPVAGTSLRRDAPVDLVVSRGKRPIDVPDVTGETAETARTTLTELGFEVEVTRAFSDDVEQGRVISQDPADGTLFRGDTVTVEISRGSRTVEVPDVRRMGVEEATRVLTEAGFEVRTRESEVYIGLQFVLRTDPEPGEEIRRGSVVTLILV